MALALDLMAPNCVVAWPAGAFQWPNILWGAVLGRAGMSMLRAVTESSREIGCGQLLLQRGVPLGSNSNSRMWNEHLESSSLPPEMNNKSFQHWASCRRLLIMVMIGGWLWGCHEFRDIFVSSTKPLILILAWVVPSGDEKEEPIA